MINIIVAHDENRTIGNKKFLPWYLPEDFKLFKILTNGHTVIMGRKTWESLPEKHRPLPNRTNIVVSNTLKEGNNFNVVSTLSESIEIASKEKEIFIIGGASLYKEALDKGFVDRMYISHVDGKYEGDTYFPEINNNDWKISLTEKFPSFTFKIYERA
jgi:dihydrofolate reductase